MSVLNLQEQRNPDEIAEHRRQRRELFMQDIGWGDTTLELLPADASFRHYYRVSGGPQAALLMEDPPDRPPIPPYVMVEPFVKIAEHLIGLGLHAPKILAKNIEDGLLLIEDFGDQTFTRLLDAGEDPAPLYEMAIDTLAHLHQHPARNDIDLLPYDEDKLLIEADLFLDWYVPAFTQKQPSDEMRQSYHQIWRDLFTQMPTDQNTIVLRDFHVDNLMHLNRESSIAACGLLDFQDALIGQFSYDVMSLLEDARRDIDPDLKDALYQRYLNQMPDDLDTDGFAYAFRVLAAQRHAKVLGIFVRLYARDGKERYLDFIPHVCKLMLSSLADSVLEPLRLWFKQHEIDLSQGMVSPAQMKELIQNDGTTQK